MIVFQQIRLNSVVQDVDGLWKPYEISKQSPPPPPFPELLKVAIRMILHGTKSIHLQKPLCTRSPSKRKRFDSLAA